MYNQADINVLFTSKQYYRISHCTIKCTARVALLHAGIKCLISSKISCTGVWLKKNLLRDHLC